VNRLLLLALASCSYKAGSFGDFRGAFPGTHQTIGCIDLAVGRSADPAASGPAISYSFGNRCLHPVTIDLASIHARGHDADGLEHALVAFDPLQELRPLPLDSLFFGRETIEYSARIPLPIYDVCVDIGGVNGDEPHSETWVCP